MTVHSESKLDAALRYADYGFPVFPLRPNTKEPFGDTNGCKDATTDATQIEAWWAAVPDANIGIEMSGLVLLDVDGRENPWPGSPERTLSLGACPTSETAHGGIHRLFRQPTGKNWKNSVSKLAPMVDTRVSGGYMVAPPSIVDGKPYRWVETLELDCAPVQLPEPPPWLVLALDLIEQQKSSTGVQIANIIPRGQRDNALTQIAGYMRRAGMSEPEMLAALFEINASRCEPPLSSRDVQKIARSIAKHEPDQVTVALVEGWAAQDADLARDELQDPGPTPEGLLRAPGFISELIDYTLSVAPYPNLPMAFCGALALQATLAGRKVRDSGDNRTNIYLLGLAYSAAGKDKPRKVNAEILHAIGWAERLGSIFASGEGLQDALYAEPCMLFQTDEIDAMLQSINKSKDARHESIMQTLLTMYSSASSVFPMRRKAGKEPAGSIHQPCLSIFGTAIPTHYYDALSERMLTNGFFARMIVIECGKRGAGQEPRIEPVPSRILKTASDWAMRPCGVGNLAGQHPTPVIVPHSAEASTLLAEVREAADVEYDKAEEQGDPIGTTVWGRVSEHVRKLALVYTVSESIEAKEIGAAAVRWAWDLVLHQTRRMLFMAQSRVANTQFQADSLKALEFLRKAQGHEMSHSALLRKMRMEAKSFLSLVATLEQRGDLVVRTTSRSGSGRQGRFYALPEGGVQ